MLVALALAGCASPSTGYQQRGELKTDGKYYKDDGPPAYEEVDWRNVSEPVVTLEWINPRRNLPYEVFGVRYEPRRELAPYRERGHASWYGRRYHGRKTSSGEVYDMYAMSAAHKTLPIPSFARVTRTDDGRSVVVRINDRGPFLPGRLIDLSYVAARKLGVVAEGVSEVIVKALLPPAAAVRAASAVSQDEPRGNGLPANGREPASAAAPVAVVAPVAAPAAAAETGAATQAQAAPGKQSSGDAPPARRHAEEEFVEEAVAATLSGSGTYLQIGAFRQPENAHRLIRGMHLPQSMAVTDVVVWQSGNLVRVLVGPYGSEIAARADLAKMKSAGMEALIKALP